MNSIDFTIQFEHAGKKIQANCQKFKVSENPQIRVWYGKPLKEEVFTFYEVNKPKQRFFWYPQPEESKKESIVKSIAKALEACEEANVKL